MNKVFIDGKPAKKKWTGSARRCFVGSGVIVKVSHGCDTFLQSNRELRIWKSIKPNDMKFFQKPIAGKVNKNGGWVAQRLIKFKRGRRPISAWQKVGKLAEKYGILNDCICQIDGFCFSSNWGVRKNGMPVIYDWGF